MHSGSQGGGLGQMWNALVVTASALDPPSLLTGRDFALLVDRARHAGVPLLPVLLTSPSLPAARTSAAVAALAKACHMPVAAVRVVAVSEEALRDPSTAVTQHTAQLGLRPAGQGQQAGAPNGWTRATAATVSGGRAAAGVVKQASRMRSDSGTVRWRPSFPQVLGSSINSKSRDSSSSSSSTPFWSWGSPASADRSVGSIHPASSLASEASLRELRSSLYKLLSSSASTSAAEHSVPVPSGQRPPMVAQPISKL